MDRPAGRRCRFEVVGGLAPVPTSRVARPEHLNRRRSSPAGRHGATARPQTPPMCRRAWAMSLISVACCRRLAAAMRDSLSSSSLVGHALRARRERAGLTRARVAHESGVSVAELDAIESGRNQPSVAVLGQVARALGVSLVDLVRTNGARQADGPVSDTPTSRLGLPEIGRAIAELTAVVGSKVDAAILAAVLHSMKVCGNNQSAAARLLGMERKAFVRRLQRARSR